MYSAKHREYQLVAKEGRSQGRGGARGAPPPAKTECPLAGSGTVGLTQSPNGRRLVDASYVPYENIYFCILYFTVTEYYLLLSVLRISSTLSSNKQIVITHSKCTCTATDLRQHIASALWRVIKLLDCSVSTVRN